MPDEIVEKMRAAADQFEGVGSNESNKKKRALSVFLLHTRDEELDDIDDVWVSGENVADAILLSQILGTPETVNEAIHKLRFFLPGCISGKFSLQVLK